MPKVHLARLEQEIQGGLGFQLGAPAALNPIGGRRREAPRWGQTPFFLAWRITWAAGVAFSRSIRLLGASFKPCSKPRSRPRPEDIQVFHSFFFRPAGRPRGGLPRAPSPTCRASASWTERLRSSAPVLFSSCTRGPPDARHRILSFPVACPAPVRPRSASCACDAFEAAGSFPGN